MCACSPTVCLVMEAPMGACLLTFHYVVEVQRYHLANSLLLLWRHKECLLADLPSCRGGTMSACSPTLRHSRGGTSEYLLANTNQVMEAPMGTYLPMSHPCRGSTQGCELADSPLCHFFVSWR